MDIAIIGGGAAGFFAAINIKELNPKCRVTIYESSARALAKVGVSGGGRCNLTNSFAGVKSFSKIYPRGEKLMKRVFKVFNHEDAYKWFEDNGVRLTTQSDGCVFPVSQNSQEIIDTFHRRCRELGVEIKLSHRVIELEKVEDKFYISTEGQKFESDVLIVTTGGIAKSSGFSFLKSFDLEIVEPTPSLFSFNIKNNPITELTGAVVENAIVGMQGSKLRSSGALLITHWGVSGPAILKLSSYAARLLKEVGYSFNLIINWTGSDAESVGSEIEKILDANRKRLIANSSPFGLSSRTWAHILSQAGIPKERRWDELGSKGFNRIVEALTADIYKVSSKSTHKEEFVTCGGVSLKNINASTMESYKHRGLYFAGEVLDIDAITGGFNLQAAWSTAYVIAKQIVANSQ